MHPDSQAEAQLLPQLQTLSDSVRTIRQEVEHLTQGLTEAQILWSPDRERWSLALCLDHLNKVGYALLPRFEAAIQQLEAEGMRSSGPFRYSALERWFIRIVSPNPPMKIPVPAIFIPSTAPDALGDVLPRFLALQDSLLQCLRRANGLTLTHVKITSPVSPLVRLSLGAYLEATITHEKYHLLQAQEMRTHPDFPLS